MALTLKNLKKGEFFTLKPIEYPNENQVYVEWKLASWAENIFAVCLSIGVAFLGVWIAAPAIMKIVNALEKLVRLIRRTIASELRNKRMIVRSDLRALNSWIREADEAKARVKQERSMRQQLAKARVKQERSMRQQLAKGEGYASTQDA